MQVVQILNINDNHMGNMFEQFIFTKWKTKFYGPSTTYKIWVLKIMTYESTLM